MQLPTQDSSIAPHDSTFRRAKIEHYLHNAEELFRMSRYSAALNTLNTVFAIEPDSKPAIALKEEITKCLGELSFSEYHPANGHQYKPARRGELILVVDQDERVLTLLTESLRRYGFGALGASNFDEALEVLGKYKPAMIISEVNFENGPVGFDLFLWIRTNTELGTIPFLFLATRVTREMLIAGKRMGVNEFILKPLDEEVVMASIINCLPSRRKRTV